MRVSGTDRVIGTIDQMVMLLKCTRTSARQKPGHVTRQFEERTITALCEFFMILRIDRNGSVFAQLPALHQ